ncbi:hypothetical protein WMW72_03805 [Paenibacillus filicis]|uniref:Uncharacterized protein n=1 Tax=Paenibacillus filicis TaxID=669464 RepID=A0ABU9DDU8_9BACL
MAHPEDQICPWCQSEIVWDPEIGPESACPHCFNDLGEYRSIQLTVPRSGQLDRSEDEDEDEDEDFDAYEEFDENELEGMDEYEEGAQRLLDHQEEAPECPSCQSFMLLAGVHRQADTFEPFVHRAARQPLLPAGFASQVFVCPSCFKVEHILAEKDRLAMTQLLKQVGSQ